MVAARVGENTAVTHRAEEKYLCDVRWDPAPFLPRNTAILAPVIQVFNGAHAHYKRRQRNYGCRLAVSTTTCRFRRTKKAVPVPGQLAAGAQNWGQRKSRNTILCFCICKVEEKLLYQQINAQARVY